MSSIDTMFHSVVDKIDTADSLAELPDVLDLIKERYGLQNVAYFAVNLPAGIGNEPFLAVTYSQEWIDHYKECRYVKIDPVLSTGFSSILPIDWRDLDHKSSRLRNLFGEAADFNVGRQGLTFPVRGPLGERALFTISGEASDQEWDGALNIYKRDFHAIAHHFHWFLMRSATLESEMVHLSPREIECLKWAAKGKTTAQIADILSLSERTVRFYQDRARVKLKAANITHAVSRALDLSSFALMNDLSNPPY